MIWYDQILFIKMSGTLIEDKMVSESKMESEQLEHENVVYGLNDKIRELKVELSQAQEQLAAAQKSLVDSLGCAGRRIVWWW